MPLLTLKQAAKELGYTSLQSIYNLAKKGELPIGHLPNAGGSKRRQGSPRVDAADVEALKARMRKPTPHASSAASGGADDGDPSSPPPRARVRIPKSKPVRVKMPKNVIHFE